MLELYVKGTEYYDAESNTFFSVESETLLLEHSLSSLTKWEAKTKKPFFETLKKGLSVEETIEYLKCMTLEKPKSQDIYLCITSMDLKKILEYIEDPQNATRITTLVKRKSQKAQKETVTSEIIYYWMIESDIPFECENWNINRLMTLIEVISIKRNNSKMSSKELRDYNRALMASRRAKH